MLTDVGIRALAAPTKGVKRYWDKDGLCVQVSQGGTKTFYFVHGTGRQFRKIGRYPTISLSQARDRVRSIAAKQTLGIDDDDSSKHTVQDAIDRFCATHCDVRNKPRTAKDTRRFLTYLAPIARRAIGSVKTAEVLNIVDTASASINQRRHVFVASRTFFRWAARQRLIKASPLQDVQPPGVSAARDRVLTDEEVGEIYNAAVKLGYGEAKRFCDVYGLLPHVTS
jgi:hypothetical protein